MVTMMTHRMMDSLSCSMLLAKDEFQANMHTRSATLDNIQAQLDSELARENALLQQQLLEAVADNNAISKSLQERVQSLSDTTDAKIRAETEVKMFQVRVKAMQQDIDGHKYELHLLRKQLQIRNEEKDHHKKSSDASYKQHLENVKKIARLESECQRLRSLIRQRLPGPAAIAQMRAECDIHIKMGIKKKALSATPTYTYPSKSPHNSSNLQAQKEIEGLKERLLSVEDEAKFLKEAMTKRTAELQEARQLCARTAMKLSAAQALAESVASMTNSVCSTSSTPMHLHSKVSSFESADRLHAYPNQDISGDLTGENNRVYASSTMHDGHIVDDGILDVKNGAGHTEDGELDEISCAESWASALFTELSHLSNLQEDTSSVISCGSIISQENHTDELSKFKKDNIVLNADMQQLDINSALEMVHQRLSSVGETLLTSFKAGVNSPNTQEEMNDGESVHSMWKNDTNSSLNHDILEEVVQIKGLLINIDRAMEMGNGSTKKYSFGHTNGNELACNGELIVKKDGQKLANWKGERGLSRLRCNSLDYGHDLSAKFSEEDYEMELRTSKFSEQTDEMEEMCTKLGDEAAKNVGMGTKFSEQTSDVVEARLGAKYSDKTDMGSIISEEIAKSTDLDAKFSEDFHISGGASTAATGGGKLNCTGDAATSSVNLAALAKDKRAGEGSDVVAADKVADDVASERDADMELQRLLHVAQAELELARGRIVTLEAELAQCMQEKADVVNELADTRSLQQSLEAELASTVASMEDLKLQLSALKAQAAEQAPAGNVSPFQGGPPTLTDELDVHASIKEEHELAAARAQLADCQRSIHEIRNQIAIETQHVAIQDVINDDQAIFDTSSESSKSAGLSSHLPSPISDNLSFFVNMSSNSAIAKPMEVVMTQEECNTPYFPTLSKECALQEDDSSQLFRVAGARATKQQMQQNLERCEDLDDEIKDKALIYLTRTSSKGHVVQTPQSLSKPPKLSAAFRISEFFSRAKLSTRGCET